MVEPEITFENKTEIRVQAQIFEGRTLISTYVVAPSEICILPVKSMGYDIFFKDSSTGWEIARKLGSNANSFTLSQNKRRYTLLEAQENKPLKSVTKSELAVKRSTK
ncbi:MAG: hypothetical protein GWP61_22775 [Chloroflexi bacterium]|nr:hypothetical protein [Chloroflexota bacterium]